LFLEVADSAESGALATGFISILRASETDAGVMAAPPATAIDLEAEFGFVFTSVTGVILVFSSRFSF
jgi:hypothetical protein